MKHPYKTTKPQWPVSQAELRHRWKACKKEESLVSGIWTIIFFIFLFVCVATAEFIEQQPRWVEKSFIVVFFGILFANLFFIFKTLNDRMRAYHLVCPTCSKTINARRLNYILHTHHCPHCRHELIQNSEPEPVAVKPGG